MTLFVWPAKKSLLVGTLTLTVLLWAISARSFVAAQETANQLSLRSVNGDDVDLSQKRGKVIVLSFDATWVPRAEKRIPALQKLAELHASRNAEFYWVSVDSLEQGTRNYASDDELRAYAQENGLQLTVLRDPDLTVYKALGVERLPTLVIVGQNGQVHSRYVEFDLDRSDFSRSVNQVLHRLIK